MIGPGEGNDRRGVVECLVEFARSDNTDGVFYGWRLVLIGFLIILVGREVGAELTAAAWSSRALEHVDIGPPWNAVAIAGGVIGSLLSLLIAGRGVDRFGPKRMAQVALPLVGLVVLLAALPVPGVVQATFTGIAALALIGAYVPAITALNNWFRDRLGLALSLMLCAVAIGRMVFDLALAALLLLVDWRILTLALGLAIVVVALPLARLMRNHPEDSGEHPDGLAPVVSTPDYTWREAMRSSRFWTLMAAGCCVAVAATIANVYAVVVISESSATFEAVEKFGTYKEYASIAGILAGGLASYRFPVRYVLSASAVAQTLGMVLLLIGFGPALLEAEVLLGIASGMATAPGIAAVGVYFGRRSFGTIIVTMFLINQIVPSAVLAGAGYTSAAAGYVAVFVATAIISLIGAGLYLALGQPRLSPSQQVENPAIN